MARADQAPGIRPRVTLGRRLDIAARYAFPAGCTLLLMLLAVAPYGIADQAAMLPAVTFACVYFWSLLRPGAMPPPVVFVVGLLLDLLGYLPLGVGALTLLIVHGLAVHWRPILVRQGFVAAWLTFAGFAAGAAALGLGDDGTADVSFAAARSAPVRGDAWRPLCIPRWLSVRPRRSHGRGSGPVPKMRRDIRRSGVFTRRALLMMGGQVALLGGLAARLYQVQVVDGTRYATLAEENRVNTRLIAPPRGRMLDRFGIVVAGNRLNWRALLVAEQTSDTTTTLDNFSRIVPLGGL